MCDFSTGIKFCTCKNQMTSQDNTLSYWTLKRYFGQDWLNLEIGRCHIASYNQDEQEIADWILYHLNLSVIKSNIESNDESCFDFDYQPVAGDTLNLQIKQNNNNFALNIPLKLEFIFKNQQWQQSLEISNHLNKDLIIYQGMLKVVDKD